MKVLAVFSSWILAGLVLVAFAFVRFLRRTRPRTITSGLPPMIQRAPQMTRREMRRLRRARRDFNASLSNRI